MTTESQRKASEAERVLRRARFGAIASTPAARGPVPGRDEKPDAGRVVEDRNVEADRLAGQDLHHQPGGARPAARGAADFVVVGLIAQNAAKPVLRQRQAQELQRSERAGRADGLDIGGVLVHGAARAERIGQRPEVVAAAGGVGGVERLLVGAGAGRRAAERALACDRRRRRRGASASTAARKPAAPLPSTSASAR